jgi:hypothetical protein
MDDGSSIPLCTPDPAMIGYTFVRHVGFMLDELSSQGLEVWLDEGRRWHWRWSGSAPGRTGLLGAGRSRGGRGRQPVPGDLRL